VNAREYYSELQAAIHSVPQVWRSDLRFEEIDEHECYVSGVLLLTGGYELYVAEYVTTSPTEARLKYRYHLQTPDGQLVSRWDNAPHHPDVATFPDHRHDDQGEICSSPPMTVPAALESALSFILPAQPD
jgi:hypothetical protein